MRVFDLGGMLIWLVWFFRHKDEPEDDSWWDEGGGGGPEPPPGPDGPGGSGLDLPLPDAGPWPARVRDHRPERRGIDRRPEPARREREREPA